MFETFGPTAWAIAVTAVLLTGISKGGFGSALGGVAVPLLALFMPASTAAALMLPILCLMDASGIRAYWGKWSKEDLWATVPGALCGIVLGTLAFGLLSDRALKGVIGTIAIVFVADRLFGLRAKLKMNHAPGRVAGGIWGGISGVTSTLAHAGGPPVLVYLLGRNLPKQTFVATTVVFFGFINLAKLLPYAALGLFTPDVLLTAAILAPLAPLGVWLGVHVQRLVPERPFFFIATAGLGLSGLKLLWDAFK
ncbi:sulfite exporter TauE/SafE family protein [Uliginosibacterium sp. H1]|uniref:sulfite exporter TauE/SafE family protein n=1 Tax=Uliginosibacterium sp. H1 TaxID=3114757 RepID=UPI002E16DC92|nr:sulfite exporter TauE/SafE family protein [Uliginosibacterium sp. H1]